jgi:hypothetical protein
LLLQPRLDFDGLTGRVRFDDAGERRDPTYSIVNLQRKKDVPEDQFCGECLFDCVLGLLNMIFFLFVCLYNSYILAANFSHASYTLDPNNGQEECYEWVVIGTTGTAVGSARLEEG